MTTSADSDHDGPDLFVADFYPKLGEYLAKQYAGGYDAVAARTRFLLWLAQHVADDEAAARPGHAELTAEREAELAARIKAGRGAEQQLATFDAALTSDARAGLERVADDGTHARNQLIEHHLWLVTGIANRYTGRGVPLPDLVREGNIGLVRAAQKFDHAKGYRFATYATWWIRQAMTRAIAARGDIPRLPVLPPAPPFDDPSR
jgi:DNA-directed RNA polymerase sigma subunit (sigma70/sigma32)